MNMKKSYHKKLHNRAIFNPLLRFCALHKRAILCAILLVCVISGCQSNSNWGKKPAEEDKVYEEQTAIIRKNAPLPGTVGSSYLFTRTANDFRSGLWNRNGFVGYWES